MAATSGKPALSPGFLAAVFIILSVNLPPAYSLQCYWCGPLAEQVHRSRRAPPCAAAAHPIVTTCEPGYDHCGIVATASPYVESRLCVKLYQDECYPLFCNTTKTWKMTCPCRGDLCNGAASVRELDAFEVLHKLVTKTQSRIKKRTTSNILKHKSMKIVNPDDDHNEFMNNSLEGKPVTERNRNEDVPPSLTSMPKSLFTPTSELVTTMIEISIQQNNGKIYDKTTEGNLREIDIKTFGETNLHQNKKDATIHKNENSASIDESTALSKPAIEHQSGEVTVSANAVESTLSSALAPNSYTLKNTDKLEVSADTKDSSTTTPVLAPMSPSESTPKSNENISVTITTAHVYEQSTNLETNSSPIGKKPAVSPTAEMFQSDMPISTIKPSQASTEIASKRILSTTEKTLNEIKTSTISIPNVSENNTHGPAVDKAQQIKKNVAGDLAINVLLICYAVLLVKFI